MSDRTTCSTVHEGRLEGALARLPSCPPLAPRGTVLVLGLLLAAACTDPSGPEGEVRVGVIAGYGMEPEASAPDTVERGAPFEVSVRTFGSGCTTEGETETRAVAARTIEVTPYDVHTGHICNDVLLVFDHRATLIVHEPGVLLVRFRGQRAPDGNPLSIEREVLVR